MNKFLKSLISHGENSLNLYEMKKRLDFVINIYEGLNQIQYNNSKVPNIPISLETYISILKYIRNGGKQPNLKSKGE